MLQDLLLNTSPFRAAFPEPSPRRLWFLAAHGTGVTPGEARQRPALAETPADAGTGLGGSRGGCRGRPLSPGSVWLNLVAPSCPGRCCPGVSLPVPPVQRMLREEGSAPHSLCTPCHPGCHFKALALPPPGFPGRGQGAPCGLGALPLPAPRCCHPWGARRGRGASPGAGPVGQGEERGSPAPLLPRSISKSQRDVSPLEREASSPAAAPALLQTPPRTRSLPPAPSLKSSQHE